ncbi:unnamed protein product [Blepharisma stoltei]|uniref:Uncharacterized protein n=1 Tax=Blepharisma stoltei TaxID=1481888 RepID=A0AAU9JS77_9CILI|nr:unnamed protein product [Blepharisma stoltei]
MDTVYMFLLVEAIMKETEKMMKNMEKGKWSIKKVDITKENEEMMSKTVSDMRFLQMKNLMLGILKMA